MSAPGASRFGQASLAGARLGPFLLGLTLLIPGPAATQENRGRRPEDPADTLPTLGLEQGISTLDTPAFSLDLVNASQTAAALRPKGADGFDFTPSDWLQRRNRNGFFQLGDLTLRLRTPGSEGWAEYSTAADRKPVVALEASGRRLAAADLAPTLPADMPLRVRRYWEIVNGQLSLRFELENPTGEPVEIGALGIPMIFNNILQGRSLDEAHAVSSFHDPYIGQDAGYLQVSRLTGSGPTLVVVPREGTPFEAYNPLLSDPTRRGTTFEGFFEWTVHSLAFAEEEWSEAEPWNPPTSATLDPGETRSYGVTFLVADGLRAIEPTLVEHGRPVAVGIPGYILPTDLKARLFLQAPAAIEDLRVEPPGALRLTATEPTPGGWRAYDIEGQAWGRSRVTVTYADGTIQTIHYRVVNPEVQVVSDMGHFLTTEAWYENPRDPFGRSPSVITYDYEEKRQVTEDSRAWVAGLGDEGGGGAWLAAIMKQLIQPDPGELKKMQRFADEVVWGGLQYADGELRYGVRKSLFYYEPEEMPEGTYSEEVGYGGWSSWDKEEAMSVGRSYDYIHVAALYWVLYRLARNHRGLATNHPWSWYLERAFQTGEAMVRYASHYAQFGQMGGTVFLMILRDLQREGWTEKAAAFEATMRARAEVWRALGYPFGSEMPWDSTGQEEVYGWSKYFGFDEKALVTLNAILAYMPTVPHWGYNGSARRYWDFQYAGKLRRIERQLHHYGSALNAIPVLSEYRERPDDFYLLRVGYAGTMGALANITQDGFPPAAFHSYPSTLRIDGITGDYGPGFLAHAITSGTYLTQHPEFGWVAFGGNVASEGDTVTLKPLDSARSRVFLAPFGLWLTLDAGTFESVEFSTEEVRLHLNPATRYTPNALLRVERTAEIDGGRPFSLSGSFEVERGAYVIPLAEGSTSVLLRRDPSSPR